MIQPARVTEHLRQAHALLAASRLSDAERLCRSILDAFPNHADALALLGTTLLRQRKARLAVDAFRTAVEVAPTFASAWNGLGLALDATGRSLDAVPAFERAAGLDPAEPRYRFNLGNVLRQLKRHGDAATAYGIASRSAPENATFLSAALRERQQACLWDDMAADTGRLFTLVANGQTVHPFRLVALGAPLALQRRNAEAWTRRVLPSVPALAGLPSGAVPAPLIVGYISGDFREHPVPSLMADLLGAHDRDLVRVHAYSFGADDDSEWRQRVRAGSDRFIDLAGVPDTEAARRIHADGVHVLVDLMGWTRESRPGIFAHRPAPVQVGWLGYPGTLGTPALDYIVADPIVLPEADNAHYVEHVVRLPDCYQPNSRRPAAPTPTRAAAGLPESSVVYCCFNLAWKIDPTRFALWMQLLAAVPGSVLWMLDGGADANANLHREAEAAGIDPQRLVIAPRLAPAEHLARCRLADLFLDTLPYNGHTTGSDALWAGCPVLTRPGDGFAGRVAASLLTAAGLPELIAADDDAYLATARRLGERPDELAALRARLSEPEKLPLFDTPRFARHIEAAYAEMWRRGGRPAGFDVLPGGGIAENHPQSRQQDD